LSSSRAIVVFPPPDGAERMIGNGSLEILHLFTDALELLFDQDDVLKDRGVVRFASRRICFAQQFLKKKSEALSNAIRRRRRERRAKGAKCEWKRLISSETSSLSARMATSCARRWSSTATPSASSFTDCAKADRLLDEASRRTLGDVIHGLLNDCQSLAQILRQSRAFRSTHCVQRNDCVLDNCDELRRGTAASSSLRSR